MTAHAPPDPRLADLLARTTPLSQVGIVTTLLGGPFFLWLLRRERG